MPSTDSDIIEDLKDGDVESLVSTHGHVACAVLKVRFVDRQTLNDDEAHDAFIDAILTARDYIDSFNPVLGTLRAWFIGIATKFALRKKRKNIRRPRVFDPSQLELIVARKTCLESEVAKQDAMLRQVMNALSILSPMERSVIRHDLDDADTTDSEFAATLKTTPKSVQVSRAKAKAKLRQHFGQGDNYE